MPPPCTRLISFGFFFGFSLFSLFSFFFLFSLSFTLSLCVHSLCSLCSLSQAILWPVSPVVLDESWARCQKGIATCNALKRTEGKEKSTVVFGTFCGCRRHTVVVSSMLSLSCCHFPVVTFCYAGYHCQMNHCQAWIMCAFIVERK